MIAPLISIFLVAISLPYSVFIYLFLQHPLQNYPIVSASLCLFQCISDYFSLFMNSINFLLIFIEMLWVNLWCGYLWSIVSLEFCGKTGISDRN